MLNLYCKRLASRSSRGLQVTPTKQRSAAIIGGLFIEPQSRTYPQASACECVLQKLKGETVKFLHMLIVLLALAAFALSLFAGLSYSFSGHGLHPIIAGLLGGFAGVAGWWSAGKVGLD